MFSWLGILRLVLTVANKIADIIGAEQLMSAGEDRATARSLAMMADRLGIGRQVEDELDRMRPEQIDDILKEDTR